MNRKDMSLRFLSEVLLMTAMVILILQYKARARAIHDSRVRLFVSVMVCLCLGKSLAATD